MGLLSRSLCFREALLTKYWCTVGSLWLRLCGVVMAGPVSLYGIPLVRAGAGTRITLGKKVTLVSDSRFTALGVSRPTVLRTLGHGAEISIGDDSGLSGTVICAASRVSIGRRCLIGADVKIVDTDFHAIDPRGRRYGGPDVKIISRPVVIEDDVFIGTGVIVLKGVTIGRGSVVGAGAVVVKSIPPNSIVAGNPGRVIGQIDCI